MSVFVCIKSCDHVVHLRNALLLIEDSFIYRFIESIRGSAGDEASFDISLLKKKSKKKKCICALALFAHGTKYEREKRKQQLVRPGAMEEGPHQFLIN